MGLVGFVIVAAVFAAVAWAAAQVPVPRIARTVQWWRLVPLGQDPDPAECRTAAAIVGSSGRILVALSGNNGQIADRWVGMSMRRGQKADNAARSLAKAAGCELGAPCEPPPLPRRTGGWWYSNVWATDDPRDPEMGIHRYEGALAVVAADAVRLSGHLNGMLHDDQQMLMLTARPKRGGRVMHCVGLATTEDLARSWVDSPAPTARRPPAHPAVWLAYAACALGLLPIPLWAGFNIGGAVEAVLGGAAAAGGGYAAFTAFRRSPVLRDAGLGRPLPVPAIAGGPISAIIAIGRRGEDPRARAADLSLGLISGWCYPGASAAITVPKRLAPDPVRVPDGAHIGADVDGHQVYLPDRDRHQHVFILGDPASGKTVLAQNYLHRDSQRRAEGAPHTIFLFESKGEGAAEAVAIMRSAGLDPLVFEVGSTAGARLELVNRSQPERYAHTLRDAMMYAFGPREILGQSREMLRTALQASIGAGADKALALGYPPLAGEDGQPSAINNVVETAFWMLGGGEIDKRPELVAKIFSRDLLYREVLDYDARVKRGTVLSEMREAPRNKLSDLSAAQGLWNPVDPDGNLRPYALIRDLLKCAEAVVIDLSPVGAYSETLSQRCTALIMYALWDEINTFCQGWQDQGKSIGIFCDELSNVSRDASGGEIQDIVERMAAAGRSRGVEAVFATQYPEQINSLTLQALNGFGTRHYFQLKAAEIAREAARSLYDEYDAQHFSSLRVGQCVSVLARDGQQQRPFLLCPQKIV